jgi:hypothetical protein
MHKENLLKVFQDKKWMDETIDLINDDGLRNKIKKIKKMYIFTI